MNEIYEEYKQEYPEELENVKRLFSTSDYIVWSRRMKQEKRKKLIEECKLKLEGK